MGEQPAAPGGAGHAGHGGLLAASLDHPNVLPIHEAGEQDGRLYLAMRFVDGSHAGR